MRNILDLLNQVALAENRVTRQVGAKVSSRRGKSRFWISRICHFNDRTWFWIALTKEQKIGCVSLGENYEIRLQPPRELMRRDSAPLSAAHRHASFRSGSTERHWDDVSHCFF